ncbi:myotubularin-related protein 14-like [Mercenaria mercenaria]|uniref:myotubularin-related protein 14-like n=1 Tax=Mercenaria mercenaria TaxID=6596 RepID=UPI00234F4391|nr:myotubularin-related protein 14-like [Mercenaria mercenaria]
MTEACDQLVRADEIHALLEHFSKNSYRVKGDPKGDPVTGKCLKLYAKDYQFTVINNTAGDLCAHYPSKLAVLEYEKCSTVKERVESLFDSNKVKNIFKQARFARCRSRFVIPVILFEGKHVCRSATVSSGAEMYSRSGLDFIFTGGEQSTSTASKSVPTSEQSDMQMFDRVRGQDINVLKTFSVKYIVDLMVEKKKVKFGMNVTSSEKVDKENRYGEFCIVSVPYPGCEFFKEWKDNSYLGEVMQFDWTQGYVDACLDIPPTEVLRQLSIDWSQYKSWNLIQLTQNYLKMMLHVLSEGDKGVLVHCISGWDRTPMFVSLLRLSLWADGAIHKSLTAAEILYLTLAYDWYLFGHNLSDRLNKGEEILLFCFYFLSNITSEEYSIHSKKSSKLHSSLSDTNGVIKAPETYSSGLRRHLNNSSSSLASVGGCQRKLSSGSAGSNSGPIDSNNPLFYISGEDEVVINGSPASGFSQSDSFHPTPNGSRLQAGLSCKRSSSPILMQSNRGRQSSISESPTCGSWQVISGTGSLISTECHSTSSQSFSKIGSCEEALEAPASERWEKLDAVRRIFNNAYHNKITTKFKPDTGIMNQLSERLGFKQSKGFF